MCQHERHLFFHAPVWENQYTLLLLMGSRRRSPANAGSLYYMKSNIFQCPNCGGEAFAGDVSCSLCGMRFQYYCPRCQSPVMGGDAACARCGYPLNWPAKHPTVQQSKGEQEAGKPERKSKPWLLPLIGLVFILVVAAVATIYIKNLLEQPPKPDFPVNRQSPGTVEDTVLPDNMGPLICEVTISNVNYSTVEIHWKTDEPSTTQVLFRVNDGTQSASDKKDALVTEHVVELTNLKNKSTYYYRVKSVDQFSNESLSDERSFDIGIVRGIPKVEVAKSYMVSSDQPDGVLRTYIKGEIKNSGEVTLNISEVEVSITLRVAGKTTLSEVKAYLDPTPQNIHPQEFHKFSAEVPARTEPDYNVTTKILQP
jgi:hypothetical protein